MFVECAIKSGVKRRSKSMSEIKQFNTRIPGSLRDAAAAVCDHLGWTRDEFGEVAVATLLGSSDGLIREKRKKIVEAARELSLSFNDPQGQLPGIELAA